MPKVDAVSEPFGLLNCGVLVKLKVSARSSTLARSPILKLLNSDRFSANNPGPLMMLRPVVPKLTPVGWEKLAVANQGLPVLMPCKIWTGATWLAVWVSPGVLRLLPLAVMLNGVPVNKVRTPERRQLPRTHAAGPEAHRKKVV